MREAFFFVVIFALIFGFGFYSQPLDDAESTQFREIEFVDRDGNVRAKAGVDSSREFFLRVYDSNRRERARLGAGHLIFTDSSERASARVMGGNDAEFELRKNGAAVASLATMQAQIESMQAKIEAQQKEIDDLKRRRR